MTAPRTFADFLEDIRGAAVKAQSFAAGMTSPIWPTQEATGRIVVFGLR